MGRAGVVILDPATEQPEDELGVLRSKIIESISSRFRSQYGRKSGFSGGFARSARPAILNAAAIGHVPSLRAGGFASEAYSPCLRLTRGRARSFRSVSCSRLAARRGLGAARGCRQT